MFNPTEIIFSATTACNLKCAHCYVNRSPQKLSIDDAKAFLKTAVESNSNIDRIGFSGGEPFLYIDFITELTKQAISLDLMFDQIMTNGDWWKDETDLITTLQKIYDAGYDGKIGLSWDSFHNQTEDRMITFIQSVQKIWGPDSINVQRVQPYSAFKSTCNTSDIPENVNTYILPQSFTSEDERTWKSKKWFKEDYCEGPGQILYIHADGNIAPCCGFANENKELFIGTIKDDFNTVINNAQNNKMIEICYEKGLLKYRKVLKKQLKLEGKKLPGKCGDICSFCDFVCKNLKV